MSIQKNIVYEITDWSGQKLNKQEVLKLNVSENKANYLIHRAFVKQQVENRQGTVSTKTKSEVRGGGRKPWQQKGRGRARAGSIRSPLWRGGGVTFGPKPKSIKVKLNKKEWKLSLQSLLYNKRDNFILVDNFNSMVENKKTKILSEKIKNLVLDTKGHILLIVCEKENNLLLASRNLKQVKTIQVDCLNIKSLLEANKVILSINSLKKIEEIYAV